MKPIKLSICICSLHSRSGSMTRLIQSLQSQYRSDETEIVIIADAGQELTGIKRNRLIAQTIGQYIVHIDDDDAVADTYIPDILRAIDKNNGVDAILIRGRRIELDGGSTVIFDYKIGVEEGSYIDGILYRNPGHLCAIRADIVKENPFPIPCIGEDLAWSAGIRNLLKTSAKANNEDKILYFYQWNSQKSTHHQDYKLRHHSKIFTPQYKDNSGPGSDFEYTAPYRQFLEKFIFDNEIKSILDLGCGDMRVMGSVDLQNARYHGVDCILERITKNLKMYNMGAMTKGFRSFEAEEFNTWKRYDSDLVISKDVLQHWSNDDVSSFIEKLKKSSFRFALITNCNYGLTVNQNIETGGWRALDITKSPFSVGEIVFSWETKDVVLIRGNRAN